jgi:hypothetical protein
MKRAFWLIPLVGLVLLPGSCVNVYVIFPEAKVEAITEDFLYQVSNPELAKAAVSVSNPAIEQLNREMAENHKQLLPHYTGGEVGISRNGLLELRDASRLGMKELGALKRLLASDNRARERFALEVVRELGIDPSQAEKVGAIFAVKCRQSAPPGCWVQNEKGLWSRKQGTVPKGKE